MSVTGRFATRSARRTDPLDLETAETVAAARDLDEQLRARPGSSRLAGASQRTTAPQRVIRPLAAGRPPRSRTLRQPSSPGAARPSSDGPPLSGRIGEGRRPAAYRKRQRVAPYGSAVATPNAVCNAKR
jgi:hypothetical protein